MVSVLSWRNGLASQPWIRFSASPGSVQPHAHDFVEWFWIDAGRMRHEWAGQVTELQVGDVMLLHPEHQHHIAPLTADASHIVMSVEPALFQCIAARLRPQVPDWPFPQRHQPPQRRHVSLRALARFRHVVELLPVREQTPADAELAVAATIRILADAGQSPSTAPAWLRGAVAALDDLLIAARGVSAFIQACGHPSALVCRACRRFHACRPNALVEGVRLDHAARQLRASRQHIRAIAGAYASLSHFYRAFARRFTCAPAAYRGADGFA